MPLYQSKRLRIGRQSEVGRTYIITTSTLGRAPLFADWKTGRLVVAALRKEHEAGFAETLAWVVMPDHVHWLVELRRGCLSALVRRFKARSALAINARLGRSGVVWQKGFHDRAMRRTEDLKAAARYIIYNPVRAGIAPCIGQYPLWDAAWL